MFSSSLDQVGYYIGEVIVLQNLTNLTHDEEHSTTLKASQIFKLRWDVKTELQEPTSTELTP